MAWSIAGALTLCMGIRATSAGYTSRIANAQCYTDATEYSGDRLDNPIFEGGGFIGSLTLAACQKACDEETDTKGRPCVAIEWSDGGNAQSDSTTKSCALAWACDYIEYWSGGSVFMQDVDLSWISWSPGDGLSVCQGDCDSDSDCSGELECYHDGVPPTCSGSVYNTFADYCYAPDSSAKTAFAERHVNYPPDPDQAPWTVALSGKDLVILVLVAVNVAVIVALCCVCARSGAHGARKKYQMVRMMGGDESEDV